VSGNVAAQRKYRYGLSARAYTAMLEAQHGKCAACGDGETVRGRGGEMRSLCVDHCHATGGIRGLLCDRCNTILGRAKDSPSVLRRLASYLEVADPQHYVPDLARANSPDERRLQAAWPQANINPEQMLNELQGEL
jgi:hypothetical protein